MAYGFICGNINVLGTLTIIGFNPDANIGAVILTNQSDVDLHEILLQVYKVGVTLSQE